MSHIPSAGVIEPVTMLDSIDERVIKPCFFDAQEIGAPLKTKIHLVVDFDYSHPHKICISETS